jgi:hypothetical protein
LKSIGKTPVDAPASSSTTGSSPEVKTYFLGGPR